jgi:hypothetical protein
MDPHSVIPEPPQRARNPPIKFQNLISPRLDYPYLGIRREAASRLNYATQLYRRFSVHGPGATIARSSVDPSSLGAR